LFFQRLKNIFQQTIVSLKYPGIKKYFYLSLLFTFILTGIFVYLFYSFVLVYLSGLSGLTSDIGFIDFLINSIIFKILIFILQFFASWVFFSFILIPIGNLVSGYYADEIFDILNKKNKNKYKFRRKQNAFSLALTFSIQTALRTFFINLLLIPFYFILPVVNILLFILVNGYFVGREFSGNFLVQFHDREYLKKYFLYNNKEIYALGCVITFLYTLPLVNLFVPFIANVIFANLVLDHSE